jgi:hypothetical protein
MRSLLLVLSFVLFSGCTGQFGRYAEHPLPPSATVYDDGGALCIHRTLPDLGEEAYTVLILERQDGRIRYEIDVYSYGVQCIASGYLYDLPSGAAEYAVGENGPLFLTPEARPVLDWWEELIRECR